MFQKENFFLVPAPQGADGALVRRFNALLTEPERSLRLLMSSLPSTASEAFADVVGGDAIRAMKDDPFACYDLMRALVVGTRQSPNNAQTAVHVIGDIVASTPHAAAYLVDLARKAPRVAGECFFYMDSALQGVLEGQQTPTAQYPIVPKRASEILTKQMKRLVVACPGLAQDVTYALARHIEQAPVGWITGILPDFYDVARHTRETRSIACDVMKRKLLHVGQASDQFNVLSALVTRLGRLSQKDEAGPFVREFLDGYRARLAQKGDSRAAQRVEEEVKRMAHLKSGHLSCS